eukprot:tig00000204_g17770.t1
MPPEEPPRDLASALAATRENAAFTRISPAPRLEKRAVTNGVALFPHQLEVARESSPGSFHPPPLPPAPVAIKFAQPHPSPRRAEAPIPFLSPTADAAVRPRSPAATFVSEPRFPDPPPRRVTPAPGAYDLPEEPRRGVPWQLPVASGSAAPPGADPNATPPPYDVRLGAVRPAPPAFSFAGPERAPSRTEGGRPVSLFPHQWAVYSPSAPGAFDVPVPPPHPAAVKYRPPSAPSSRPPEAPGTPYLIPNLSPTRERPQSPFMPSSPRFPSPGPLTPGPGSYPGAPGEPLGAGSRGAIAWAPPRPSSSDPAKSYYDEMRPLDPRLETVRERVPVANFGADTLDRFNGGPFALYAAIRQGGAGPGEFDVEAGDRFGSTGKSSHFGPPSGPPPIPPSQLSPRKPPALPPPPPARPLSAPLLPGGPAEQIARSRLSGLTPGSSRRPSRPATATAPSASASAPASRARTAPPAPPPAAAAAAAGPASGEFDAWAGRSVRSSGSFDGWGRGSGAPPPSPRPRPALNSAPRAATAPPPARPPPPPGPRLHAARSRQQQRPASFSAWLSGRGPAPRGPSLAAEAAALQERRAPGLQSFS